MYLCIMVRFFFATGQESAKLKEIQIPLSKFNYHAEIDGSTLL